MTTRAASQDIRQKMDAMYRYQRFIYDATRKYYLLGRDRLLDKMKVSDGSRILEVGCGTARNLQILAERYASASFFGLDASREMLELAERKTSRFPNVTLREALADGFHFGHTFGLAERFDAIFFSYSISMIPPWRESLVNALENLKPGGRLYIVDFYNQRELPRWFCVVLTAWLQRFGVKFPQELLPFLDELAARCGGSLAIESVARSYAFIAELQKPAVRSKS